MPQSATAAICRLAPILLLCGFTAPSHLSAADKLKLEEPSTDARVFQVEQRLNVKGRLETSLDKGKTQKLDLEVKAEHSYRERRLPGTGRDAAALRTLRHYGRAGAEFVVAGQTSSSRLRDDRRQIVAQGRRTGVAPYSLDGSLTAGEIELLKMPGDSLALLPLLPLKAVEVGDTWQPESWVVQMLTGTEAMLKGELTCKLAEVTRDSARVTFRGGVRGATDGAGAKVELSGSYLYDRRGSYIKRFELTQHETRQVGAVSPGMDVEARVTLKREIAASPGPLTDKAAESIPLEPPAELMLLTLQTRFGVRMSYGRDWRLFHNERETAVLRLLESGSLIAQCNLTRIPAAASGKHTPERQFQSDVRLALGKRLKSITRADELEVDDGRFLYRVTAEGEANGVPMHWLYYLCAAPTGQQVTLVFAVESKLLKRLDDRDLKMVSSLEFPPQPAPPKRAATREK